MRRQFLMIFYIYMYFLYKSIFPWGGTISDRRDFWRNWNLQRCPIPNINEIEQVVYNMFLSF